MSVTAGVGAGEAVIVGALVAVAAAGAVVTAAVGAFWTGAAPHEIARTVQQANAKRRTTDLITVIRLSTAPG
jgi:hypothetical protein